MTYPILVVEVNFDKGAYESTTSPTGWVNTTARAESFQCSHGRSSLYGDFQPGSGEVIFRNEDGHLDVTNATSPYVGKLKPRRRLRITGALPTATAFTDDFPGSAFDGTKWTQIGSGGLAVSGSNLSVTNPTSSATRGLQSVAVGLTDTTITAGPFAYGYGSASVTWHPLHVVMASGQSATWQQTNGSHAIRENGTLRYSTAISPTEFVYLRIRLVGRTTYWESSPDNVTWTTRHSRNTPWSDPETARVEVKVITSGSPGGSGAMTVGKVEVVQGGNYRPVCYGFVDGWPNEQYWRNRGQSRVVWHDALSVLSTVPLPDSVWSYHVASTNPLAWYRLDDETTNVAIDSAQNTSARHGAYMVDQNLVLEPLPVSIVAEGTIDSIVPSSDRKAKNWAKVQQEVVQPLSPTWVYSLRTPVVRGHLDLAAAMVDRTFTLECWVRVKQALPLDTWANPNLTTAIRQPIMSWGKELTGSWFEVGIAANGQLYAGASTTGSPWGELTFTRNMLDNLPHYVAFVSFVSGGNWWVYVYIDGVYDGAVNLATPPVPPASTAPIFFRGKGYTSGFLEDSRGFQSAVSDLILYDSVRTGSPIAASYFAGYYGSLAGPVLTSGEAITQTLGMVAWAGATAIDPGRAVVEPGVLKGRKVWPLLREFAAAEQAPLWQKPDGTLTMLTRGWSTEQARSQVSQYTLSDAAAATLGYETDELNFDYHVDSVVNYCAVTWKGGEEVAQNQDSIDEFGVCDDSIDTQLSTPEEAQALAQWIVASSAQPRRKVDRPLKIVPMTREQWAFIFDCDFGLRITLERTTPDGRTVAEDYWVMHVTHDVEKGQRRWATSLILERADDPFRKFTLGLSVLGGPDVMSY